MSDLDMFGTEIREAMVDECSKVPENIATHTIQEERNDKITSSYCQWACFPNGMYQATSTTRKTLPPNCYQLDANKNELK